MAVVDFSNARIAPMQDVFSTNELGLNSGGFWIGNNQATSQLNRTQVKKTATQLIYLFSGIFSVAGTGFIIANSGYGFWNISNITFAVGDTFSFQIEVDIVT